MSESQLRRLRGHSGIARCAVWLAACLAAGCAVEQPWRGTFVYPDRIVPPPETPPPLVHCTDSVGHLRGTFPYIFGGTCCCNPTVELMASYQSDGYLADWSPDALRAAYQRRGIATLKDHQQCNNLCPQGPHVVKGGRCLVPPTPGTLNHEQVLSGRFALGGWEARQVAAHGPLDRETMKLAELPSAEPVPDELGATEIETGEPGRNHR